jgi:tripartite ATP-independent transporter DctP family solute receptor
MKGRKLPGTRILFSIGILLLCMFLMPGWGGAAAKFTLKVGHNQMEKSVRQQAALKFKRLVEEGSKGEIQVQVYPAQQLGNDLERLQALQMGTLEASISALPRMASALPAVQVFDLPFLFPSYEVVFKVADGKVGQELCDQMEKKLKIKGVSFWHTGFKQFTANTPIHRPEDFKGLKVRTMENPLLIAQFRAMDANPVPIDFHELYTSLQQKVVEAEENDINTIHDMKFYEVQKYITISNHAWIGHVFAFSQSFLKKLPPNLQTVVIGAARETGKDDRYGIIDAEKTMLKTMQNKGLTIIQLNPQELEAFRRKTRPVHDQFADKIGRDLINLAYREVAAAEKGTK